MFADSRLQDPKLRVLVDLTDRLDLKHDVSRAELALRPDRPADASASATWSIVATVMPASVSVRTS